MINIGKGFSTASAVAPKVAKLAAFPAWPLVLWYLRLVTIARRVVERAAVDALAAW